VQGKKDQKLQQAPREELDWVRQNAKARQAKSKARLAALRGDGRRGREDPQARLRGDPDPAGPALGKSSSRRVTWTRASTTGADRGPVVHPAAQRHRRRHRPQRRRQDHAVQDDRRLEQPDSGELKVGETVKISATSTSPAAASTPRRTLWEVVSDGLDYIKVGHVEMPSRAYVSAFGFKGPDQQKPAGVLSGGERNRLNLALTLKKGGNLLLLDEPTNDLDVETLGSLENALLEFPGCAVVISHDRWFLDRV
jgi:ATPase subunit of ABC transporter with duplicated ATPase domains